MRRGSTGGGVGECLGGDFRERPSCCFFNESHVTKQSLQLWYGGASGLAVLSEGCRCALPNEEPSVIERSKQGRHLKGLMRLHYFVDPSTGAPIKLKSWKDDRTLQAGSDPGR
jgi:hypothetical protein